MDIEPYSPHSVPSVRRGGFVQTFGIDVRAAILAVIIDVLAFGGDIVSFGALYVVELGSAIVLTFITGGNPSATKISFNRGT